MNIVSFPSRQRRRARGGRFTPLVCERLEERALLAMLVGYQIRVLPPDAPLSTSDLTQVNVGQSYDLAVTVQDLRPDGLGVFAGYLDIGYDSSKTRVQVAEIQRIAIGPFLGTAGSTTGTFTLAFGAETTAPITFGSNTATLATSIKNALAALSTIGTGNVDVVVDRASDTNTFFFQVRFTGSLYSQDVPNMTVASQNLTGPKTPSVSVTYDGDLQSGSSVFAFTEAFRSRTAPIIYGDLLRAAEFPNRIDDVGAIALPPWTPPGSSPFELVRARFIATAAGTVTFTPDVINVPRPSHDTVTYARPGESAKPALNEIDAGAAKTLTISAAPVVVANPDSATVAEDAAATTIDVLANDTPQPPAGTMQVLAVTQPANGTATFTAGNVAYAPAANFAGTDTFTYSANAVGSAVAPVTGSVTVTVTAINDRPSFVIGPNQSVTDDADYVTIPNWATGISAGPTNEASQELVFEISTDKPELFYVEPYVDSLGELSYLSAYNVSGTATVTLVLRDTGGTAGGGVDVSQPQTFTIEVTQPFRWRNSEFPVNVDGSDEDSPVSAIDAVLVINYLNGFGGGGAVPPEAPAGPPYLDVDGDNFVAPIDAVIVINYLNAPDDGGPSDDFPSEGAPLAAASAAGDESPEATLVSRDALFAAAADWFSPPIRRRRGR